MSTSINALKPADRDFSANPAESFTLPARYYYDADIFEREKPAIFYRSWHYAGHVSQLDEPGRYLTTRIHDQELFVVRDRDLKLRAFYNVCQHRGHELLKDTGKVNAIVCPYHGWAYETNGNLRHARNTGELAGFDRCEFALKPVRVEDFLGMVFVNLDPDAQPMDQCYAGLRDEILEYVPEAGSLLLAHQCKFDVASNWKILVDNFLECYHCHVAHKDFVDLVDMPSYRSTTHRGFSSHVASNPSSATSSAYQFKEDTRFGYAAWFVWPNVTIWAMPGEPNYSVLQINPAGPEHTVEHMDWFLSSREPSEECRAAIRYLDDVLQPEDIGLCESVQRGLHSFGYNQGRFVVDSGCTELSEHAVHHFQQMVMEALQGY